MWMWLPISVLLEQEKAKKVPSIVKHCIVAVMKKGKDVRGAWNICRSELTKQKYLKPPYKIGGKVSDIRMTQKGTRRAMKHSMERDGPEKNDEFKRAFRKIEPDV